MEKKKIHELFAVLYSAKKFAHHNLRFVINIYMHCVRWKI